MGFVLQDMLDLPLRNWPCWCQQLWSSEWWWELAGPCHSLEAEMRIKCLFSASQYKTRVSWFCLRFLFWWLGYEEKNVGVNGEQRTNQRYETSPVPCRTKKWARALCLLFMFPWFHGLRNWRKRIKRQRTKRLRHVAFLHFPSLLDNYLSLT